MERMELNAILPALVPAVITLIVVSVVAGLALAWTRQAEARRWIGRIWLAAAVLVVAGVVVFWVSTALVQGPHRTSVDRGLQDRQQQDLRRRLQDGGH